MNKKQRIRNRATATQLNARVRAQQPCPECGLPCEGGHWITTREVTLEDLVQAKHSGVALDESDFGFWTCSKFYGADGKRLPQFVNPKLSSDAALGAALVLGTMAGLFV